MLEQLLIAGLIVLGVAEWWRPRRDLSQPRTARWLSNLALTPISVALVAVAMPIATVGASMLAKQHDFGLLRWADVPFWPSVIVGFVALDLASWTAHFALHRVRWLWPIHRVHHSDPDVDCTTSQRFHPFEGMWVLSVKTAMIGLLGAPIGAVVLYDLIYPLVSLNAHGNFALPERLDGALRRVIVTADVHRIHHSQADPEFEKNYGTVLTLWDRLFGTYQAQPEGGHEAMTLGLAEFPDARKLHLGRLLVMPFERVPGGGSGPGRKRGATTLTPSSERA